MLCCGVKKGIRAYLKDECIYKSIPKTHMFFLKDGERSLHRKIISSIDDEKLKEEFILEFYILACRFKYESRIDGEDQKVLKRFHKVLVEVLNS